MREDINNCKISYTLLHLQNKVKRDPESYYEEFKEQHEHYKSVLRLFMMRPQEYDENLTALVMFLAQVSSYFKEDLKEYPAELMSILRQNYTILDPAMRMCFCKCLILMRNRGIIEAVDLITLFFILLRCKDNTLREHLKVHIITDIKTLNQKHKNVKLNSTLQNFMYKMLADHNQTAAKLSLDIMIELYRRHVWRDAKTVNAIATACFSKVNKILVAAHQFFLGVDEEEEKDSSESEDETPSVREVMAANKVNKKSRSRMKVLKRTKKVLKKTKKKKNKDVFDFSAIHLLHDPQGMAEKLLNMLSEMNERIEIKLMVMNLISRLVGVHQLILLNFYALLIRFLRPHQREVTKILMFAAQAAHEYVPPDAMEAVVKTIANNFITERNADEVITVGINAIKEICARCPLAISQDLLLDIVQYKKYKNKNVMMSARSLIQLFRQINPQILTRKYRNRPTEASKELNSIEYGALKAKSYIPGSEVLPIEPSNNDSANAVKEEANDSDGSWIDVSHSEEELQDDNNDEEDEWEEDEDDDEDDEEEEDEDDDEEEEDCNEEADENKESKDVKIKVETESCTDQHKMPVAKDTNDTANSKKEGPESVPIDEKEKAMIVSQSRLLSQEEFQKVKAVQISKEVKYAKGKKRKSEIASINIDTKEIVSLKDIERLHKKPKHDKETRLATVQEGREGRDKFGKKKKKNPSSGKTQKQHNKNKAFMMIKHKVRSKQKRSFKDKQIALRNALLKRRRQK